MDGGGSRAMRAFGVRVRWWDAIWGFFRRSLRWSFRVFGFGVDLFNVCVIGYVGFVIICVFVFGGWIIKLFYWF